MRLRLCCTNTKCFHINRLPAIVKISLKAFQSNRRSLIDIESTAHPESPDVTLGTSDLAHGQYSDLGEHRLAMYAEGENLFLVIDGKSIPVSESVSATHTRQGTTCELQIRLADTTFKIEYENQDTPVETPYYSESDEDADFGLWLSNVLNSAERKHNILEGWKNGI